MAKKRKTAKKRTVKKAPVKHAKEPEYMIQIGDPKNARKNVLESLREVIIFMQSYEKFKMIQDEKTAVFTQLRNDVKAINQLTDKLKHYFPKGKIKTVSEEKPQQQEPLPSPDEEVEKPKPVPVVVKKTAGELDQLEAQLKDIEGQLRTMN